ALDARPGHGVTVHLAEQELPIRIRADRTEHHRRMAERRKMAGHVEGRAADDRARIELVDQHFADDGDGAGPGPTHSTISAMAAKCGDSAGYSARKRSWRGCSSKASLGSGS